MELDIKTTYNTEVGGLIGTVNESKSGLVGLDLYHDMFTTRYNWAYDMNDVTLKTGVYGINADGGTVSNNTSGVSFGMLIVFNGQYTAIGGNPIFQIAISNGGSYKTRFKWASDGWTTWK